MALLDAPEEVLDQIERWLDDLRAWRCVRGAPWCARTTAQQARWMLRGRALRHRVRERCAHCDDHCLTQLTWEAHYVPWVPYCVLHAPAELLADVQLFCTRALVLYGSPAALG